MKQPIRTEQIVKALRAGLGQRGPATDPDAWLEEIALMAMGRGDELAPEVRARLLDQIAADAGLAELLADAHGLFERKSDANARHPNARGPFAFPGGLLRSGLAIAACLLLMVGVWRVADPPAPLAIGPGGDVALYHVTPDRSDSARYWEQFEQDQLRARANRDRYRDGAIVGLATLCIVLGGGWIVQSLRRRRERYDPAFPI